MRSCTASNCSVYLASHLAIEIAILELGIAEPQRRNDRGECRRPRPREVEGMGEPRKSQNSNGKPNDPLERDLPAPMPTLLAEPIALRFECLPSRSRNTGTNDVIAIPAIDGSGQHRSICSQSREMGDSDRNYTIPTHHVRQWRPSVISLLRSK